MVLFPFSEDHGPETRSRGEIKVICGFMFSGKSEELIHCSKQAEFARQGAKIYKPTIDTLYSDKDLTSHDCHSIPSTPIYSSTNISLSTSGTDVIGVDEVTKVDAIYVKCGNSDYLFHPTIKNEKQVLLGEKEKYESLRPIGYNQVIQETK